MTLTKVVIMMCFLGPFAMLTSRSLKKIPAAYLTVTVILAIGIWLERFWVVMPSIWTEDSLPLGPVEIGMTLGFLGAFILVVTKFLSMVPTVAITDEYMEHDPEHVHYVPKRKAQGHH